MRPLQSVGRAGFAACVLLAVVGLGASFSATTVASPNQRHPQQGPSHVGRALGTGPRRRDGDGGVVVDVVIDTDPTLTLANKHTDVDDDLALLLALHDHRSSAPAIRLRAVLATFGNLDTDHTFQDLSNLANALGMEEKDGVTIARGSAQSDPLDARSPAVDVLADVLREHVDSGSEGVVVVCIGSLRNLAALSVLHPELVKAVREVVVLGGSTGEGLAVLNDFGDLNFKVDPDAVNAVMRLDVKKIIVPIQLCVQASLDLAQVQSMSSGVCAKSFLGNYSSRLLLWYASLGAAEWAMFRWLPTYSHFGTIPWDAIPVAHVLRSGVVDDLRCVELRMDGWRQQLEACAHHPRESEGEWVGKALMAHTLVDPPAFEQWLLRSLCEVR